MSYAEQLKKPQWQKKRLEILERDEWTCQTCGDTEATLTVHHKSYCFEHGKFVDIWDYNGEDLITLCEVCHSSEEKELDALKKVAFFALRESCQNAEVIERLLFTLTDFKNTTGKRIVMPDTFDIEELLHGVKK